MWSYHRKREVNIYPISHLPYLVFCPYFEASPLLGSINMHKVWALFSLGLASKDAFAQESLSAQQNSNRIFNAIHSSMRQWGSSLNHNGMSFFLATVPKGIELYHGTSESSPINGTEWLAFEPEHALVFARPHRGPPPGRGGPPGPPSPEDDDDWHSPERQDRRHKYMPWNHEPADDEFEPRHSHHDERPLTHTAAQRERARLPGKQQPLFFEEKSPEDESYGYLHTYSPKKDLRLLYLDGQSAAKSDKGTLDTQDIVLLHKNPPPKGGDSHPPSHGGSTKDEHRRPGGPMNESYRAEKLCELAQNEWEGQIDGILRMELGFEIILCSFERDLEVKRITQTKLFGMGGPPGHGDSGDGLAYYKAVASRFDGIGGNRVTLDYDHFISLFAMQNATYFDNKHLPRATNESDVLHSVNEAIRTMILRDLAPVPVNWQAIADMVVARYADRIEYLASGDAEDLHAFKAEAERLLRPFVDYSNRSKTTEIYRCATQYVPKLHSPTNLASASILNVSSTICSTLSNVADASTYREALEHIKSLKSWLAWTTWKRCRGCDYNEVCFVPIWPMGGEKEYEHPRCVSNMSEISRGYWGGMGPRHHDRNKKELR